VRPLLPFLSAVAWLFHCLIPLHATSAQERGTVFLENPALFHQYIDRLPVPAEIVLAAGVALCDRWTRIARLLTFGRGPWKRKVGALKRHALCGGPDRRIAQVPPCIRRKRKRNFGQMNACDLVAIAIDLRDQNRKRFSYLRRLFADNATSPLGPEVQPVSQVRLIRLVDMGNGGE